MFLFASGSCRIFAPLFKFAKNDNINIIHGIERYYNDETALGYLHDVKTHIQFLKFLRNEISLPSDVLRKFLSSYCEQYYPAWDMWRHDSKIARMREQLKTCKLFVFEICSIKITEMISDIDKNKYATHFYNYTTIPDISYTQTLEELKNDLLTLINLCPEDATIIFQCHLRPHIIYEDLNRRIPNREIIFESISDIIKNKPNIYLIDPSFKNTELYTKGDVYMSEMGNEHLAKIYSEIYHKIKAV